MIDYCPRTGKIIYPNPKASGHALAALQRRHNDGRTRREYHCRHCGGFHFGTLPQRIKYTYRAKETE